MTIPPATNKPIIPPGGLVHIHTLEEYAQLAFAGTETLNTIQSIVYPAVYTTAQVNIYILGKCVKIYHNILSKYTARTLYLKIYTITDIFYFPLEFVDMRPNWSG